MAFLIIKDPAREAFSQPLLIIFFFMSRSDRNIITPSPVSNVKMALTTDEGDPDGALTALVERESVVNRDLAKHVLKKIDRRIIPLLFVTYMFNFMDKTILSSAAVFGLREDNVSRSARWLTSS